MTSMDRRRFIVGTTATAITLSTVKAQAADTTGITSTEIRIGSTSPQSGPSRPTVFRHDARRPISR